jgi:hypothetical protein
MLVAELTMPSTRLWVDAPCGASISGSWAAASITGAFAGGVICEQRHDKIEAL